LHPAGSSGSGAGTASAARCPSTQCDHRGHDRGGTRQDQCHPTTEDANPAADGDGQTGDLVADPERFVVPQRGRGTDAAEPVSWQPLEKAEEAEDGQRESDHQRHECDEEHGSDGKW
jgi:hypothetical protein